MKKTNQEQVEWIRQFSPKGKFGVLRKNLSQAIGGKKDVGTHDGRHPFDVELVRVPAGTANWPLHQHAAQWEAYIILSGKGKLRTADWVEEIGPGDFIVYPPGESHQIINDGEQDLAYYVIADNPQADVIYYPDSGKYFVKPQRKVFREEIGYFADEE